MLELDDLKLDLNINFGSIQFGDLANANDSKDISNSEITHNKPQAVSMKLKNQHHYRRFTSETQLETLTDWEFEEGYSYHFLSQGDIDSFSYLKFILRQQKVNYLIASTWCMANADVEQFETYLKLGRIQKVDFYVGEIFKGSYIEEYNKLTELMQKYNGRIAIFRNHSKVYVGFGDKFNFVIESSANINTNPRCENTVITLNTDLALFYKDFYDGIISFERNFDDWQPSRLFIT